MNVRLLTKKLLLNKLITKMKTYLLKTLFILVFVFFAINGQTQPPPPPSGAGHGANGNQTGGNAPVGQGLFILLSLSIAYGGKKIYHINSDNQEK
jgi:hypothetical protein